MCSGPSGHSSKFILGLSSVDSKKACFLHILCPWLRLVTRGHGPGKVWRVLCPLKTCGFCGMELACGAKTRRRILACPECHGPGQTVSRGSAGPSHAYLRKKVPLSLAQRAGGAKRTVAFPSWCFTGNHSKAVTFHSSEE